MATGGEAPAGEAADRDRRATDPPAEPVTGARGAPPHVRSSSRLPVGAVFLALVSGLAAADHPRLERRHGLPLDRYWARCSRGPSARRRRSSNTSWPRPPLVLGGLAVGVGFKAGLFNIGGQGQFLMAALGRRRRRRGRLATAPDPIAITVATLAGMAAGAIWGFIPGALKAFSGAHEVVTTIMLNYHRRRVHSRGLVIGPLQVPGSRFAGPATSATPPADPPRSQRPPRDPHRARGRTAVVWCAAVPDAPLGFEIRTVGANPTRPATPGCVRSS